MFASGNARAAGYALLALCGWTAIYALRAITEERHLLLSNNGYAEYMSAGQVALHPGLDLNAASFPVGDAAEFFEFGGDSVFS